MAVLEGIGLIVGPTFSPQMTSKQFRRRFPDDDACKAYLVARRWPTGIRCARCNNPRVYSDNNRPFHWQCTACAIKGGYRFSVLVGTIFENASTGLRIWFEVIRLIVINEDRISAAEIHRLVGFGGYDTIRIMSHRIRIALTDPAFCNLMGIAEIDGPPEDAPGSGRARREAKSSESRRSKSI